MVVSLCVVCVCDALLCVCVAPSDASERPGGGDGADPPALEPESLRRRVAALLVAVAALLAVAAGPGSGLDAAPPALEALRSLRLPGPEGLCVYVSLQHQTGPGWDQGQDQNQGWVPFTMFSCQHCFQNQVVLDSSCFKPGLNNNKNTLTMTAQNLCLCF